jgi:hypothetical protein
MKFCNTCGIGVHPFLPFGFGRLSCPYCEYHKTNMTWKARNELASLARSIKKRSGRSTYDCIVPVKGDAEDYFVISTILKLGLNPLTTHCNSYFQNEIGWHNYHNLITQFDIDSRSFNPQLEPYREFVSHSLRRVKDVQLPIRILQHRFAFETAKQLNIPYVIYGKCDPSHYAGKFPHDANLEISTWWVYEHEMGRVSYNDLISSGAQINSTILEGYRFLDVRQDNSPKGIFLENYVYWDQIKNNLQAITHGFIPEKQSNTIDWLENAGSSVFYSLQDLLRYQKYKTIKGHDHIRIANLYSKRSFESINKKQLLNFNEKRIKDFFYKFLGSTKSGYEWYVEKKLQNVKKHISDNNFNTFEAYVPEIVSNKSEISNDSYLIYKKGI